MRDLGAVVVQLVFSALIAGVLLPLAIYTIPAARQPNVGPWIGIGVAAISFLVLRSIWPRRRA